MANRVDYLTFLNKWRSRIFSSFEGITIVDDKGVPFLHFQHKEEIEAFIDVLLDRMKE